MSALVSRNIRVDGHRTSVRLEPDMWEALREICGREGVSIGQICSEVNRGHAAAGFTSSLRVFILNYYRAAGRDATAAA